MLPPSASTVAVLLALTSASAATTPAGTPFSLAAQNTRYLSARSSLSSGQAYIRPKPNLARWAEYSSSFNNGPAARRARRADGAVGVPAAARYSPLPPLTGETITKTIVQQIKNDVTAVVDLFQGLPSDVQNVLKTALTQVLNQQIYSEDPEKQYDIVSQSILNQLNKIEKSLPDTLLNLKAPLDDSADFYTLRQCIMDIVAMGGITSEDQGTCLTQSGYSLASLQSQFNDFVDINTFVLPANAINEASKGINDYLNSVELVPALEYLIGNASESLQNVVLSVQANERDATTKAFDCWIEAISTISTVPLADRQRLCTTGRGKGVKGSSLASLEQAFINKANQYLGVLPPILAYNIQRIGLTAITLGTGSYESNIRDSINSAIWSATAATGGESATIVQDLIKCLNTMYDNVSSNDCNANANEDILQHNENIYYNYLAQFASILPKTLVLNLNATVQQQLEGDNGPDAEALRLQLQQLWEQADLGTQYESCQIEFNQCVIQAMTRGSATTDCTENMGKACSSMPPLVPGQLDSGDPYGDIAGGLSGDGKWGGAGKRHKRFQRAIRRLATDHVEAAKRAQNPVRRSGLELLSNHGL